MITIIRILSLACWVLFSTVVLADPISDAKELFERYQRLESTFDPTIADLYTNDALIKNKRFYPNGQAREIVLPAPQYKELLRSVMPLVKARGDYSTYSEVSLQSEGTAVRIAAKRFSVLKKYYSPVSLLVAPSLSGTWLIREELSESQP